MSAKEDARRHNFNSVEEAFAVLANALDRCRVEDMRTAEVFEALDLLAAGAAVAWPFEQFRRSLDFGVGDESHAGGRWQNVHASLNAIRRAISVVV